MPTHYTASQTPGQLGREGNTVTFSALVLGIFGASAIGALMH